ncbi:MAG: hypothetical protein ABIK63_00455 [candidate division WOR-3 bacterium]
MLIVTDPPFAIDFKTIKNNYHGKEESYQKVIVGYQKISIMNFL